MESVLALGLVAAGVTTTISQAQTSGPAVLNEAAILSANGRAGRSDQGLSRIRLRSKRSRLVRTSVV
jgi:hypothetical protein